MDYDIIFWKKIEGHHTNYLSGGPTLTPSHILRGLFNKKNVNECIFVIYIIQYYITMLKKEKRQIMVGAHPGIDPGLLLLKSYTLNTRPRDQIMGCSK